MRIAILRKRYVFHGGAEGFTQGLIRRLSEAGHEIHIYAADWSDLPGDNVHMHKVPVITLNSFLKDLSFALSCFFSLRKKRNYFDIVQSHDRTLLQDIYRAGDGCHREWLRQRWKRTGFLQKVSMICSPRHWLVLYLEKKIFNEKRFRKVIAISEFVKNNIIDNYGAAHEDIAVVYNGVDLDRYSPGNREVYGRKLRQRYSIREDEFVALFVGSGFERKGVEFLIRAAELVSQPIVVLVVGKGNDARYARFRQRQRVIFCGPQREIERYYAASDIFVFPTMYEPFGNVHLEALASGLPLITTKLSGAAEIIENGTQGFVVEKPEDTQEIADKVTMLMDRRVHAAMSREARRLAERFSFGRHVREMLDLYDTLRTGSQDP